MSATYRSEFMVPEKDGSNNDSCTSSTPRTNLNVISWYFVDHHRILWIPLPFIVRVCLSVEMNPSFVAKQTRVWRLFLKNAPQEGTSSQNSLFVGTLLGISCRNTPSSSRLFIATNDDHRPNELSPITPCPHSCQWVKFYTSEVKGNGQQYWSYKIMSSITGTARDEINVCSADFNFLYSVACFYRRFGGTLYLHLQGLGGLCPSSRSSSVINWKCK